MQKNKTNKNAKLGKIVRKGIKIVSVLFVISLVVTIPLYLKYNAFIEGPYYEAHKNDCCSPKSRRGGSGWMDVPSVCARCERPEVDNEARALKIATRTSIIVSVALLLSLTVLTVLGFLDRKNEE